MEDLTILESVNQTIYEISNINKIQNITSKYDTVKINNGVDTIFYGIHGSNIKNLKNVIVFLHGFPYHQGIFKQLINSLVQNENRTIVGIDLRGFGQSASNIPTNTAFTAQQYASDIYQACQLLGINTATFCGHSMSSLISLQIALSYPSLVSNIITIGGSPRFFPDSATGWNSTYTPFTEPLLNSFYITLPGTTPFYNPINLQVCQPLTSLNINQYEADFTTVDESLSIINSACLKTYGYIWYDIFTNFLGGPTLSGDGTSAYPPVFGVGPADIRDQLGSITKPILIIASEADQIVPSPASQYIFDNIGTKSTEKTFVLYDISTYGTIGHVPHLTHPNLVYENINNFLISKGL